MVKVKSAALVVPVLSNFEGFTRLMKSVDYLVQVYVADNYDNGNKGVSWSWNYGISCASLDGHSAVIVCNDDIVLEPRTFGKLVVGVDDYDLVSAINTRDFPEPGSGDPREVDYSCFGVNPQKFPDRFGWFDGNFAPAYFEDNDMYYRIELAGGRQTKLLDARMFHKGSQTQFANGEGDGERIVSHEQFRANRAYYINKWGGEPGEEIFTTPFNRGGSLKEW